jgi:hypothetical protein
MKSPRIPYRLSLATVAVAALAALTACGGGGGGAEPGSTSSTPAPTPAADAAKPLSVTGTVTGFGSIIIDGKKYDDSIATITVDNGSSQASALPLSDLKLGMTVEAKVDGDKLTQVTVRAAMFGPIERLDNTAKTLSIFGQTVKIVTDGASPTLFEGVASLSSLAVNDRVEVHGTLDANRVVVATRIERKPQNVQESVRLGGSVVGLDTVNKTFRLNALTVDYANATVTPTGQALADGLEVVAFGSAPTASTGRFTAQTVRVRAADEGAPLIVGGRVGSFASMADFAVAGQRVNASSATIEGGAAADVANGQPVAVEGKVASGVLKADKLRLLKSSIDVLASLKGEVSGFVSAGNFKLRGAVVDASSATYVSGAREDLGDGASLLVQGSVRGDVFLADRVEFLKPAATLPVKVSGELRDWNAATQTFKLMGYAARLSPSVVVEGGVVSELANARRISIEGLPNAEGVVVVSKLVLQSDVVSQVVTVLSGRVYDVSPSSFRLPGGMTVTHSSATAFETGATAEDLTNGVMVYVKGRVFPNKEDMFASWVDVVKADSSTARVLGTVSDFASRANFRVNGQRVDASNADLLDGQESSLSDGVSVMATGALVDVEGRRIFVATRLRFMR